MLKYLLFEGGLYKHERILEFLEDVGGFLVQKTVVGLDLIMNLAVPEEELEHLSAIVSELKGKLTHAPLIGTEIGVVAPTLSRHHLPHPACDIAENLRRHGAKTNIIGLSRGVGQKIIHTNIKEKELIEEHDIAVFTLGNFEKCLMKKTKLFSEIEVPVIVTGGPLMKSIPGAEAYVGGIGRYPERARTGEAIEKLREVSRVAGEVVEQRRREMDLDPLVVDPIVVKAEIERQVPESTEALSPNPVTLKIDGVRVKLPYDDYKDKIANVAIGDKKLSDFAEINRSLMRNYILVKVLPKSMF